MKLLSPLLLSTGLLMANPVLDLLEGKSDGSELFPRYFEEKEDEPVVVQEEVQEEEQDEKRAYVASKFPERSVPVVNLYTNDRNRIVQQVAVDGSAEFHAYSGSYDDQGRETDIRNKGEGKATLGIAAHLLYSTDVEARMVFDGSNAGLERLRLTLDLTDPMIPVHNTLQRMMYGLLSVVRTGLSPLEKINGGEEFIPYGSVNPVESAKLRFGKYRPRFGSQYNLDPTLRMTPDLPELVKQVAPANTLGVEYIEYNDHWNYRLGYFADDTSRGVPSFRSGGLFSAGLGYSFGNVELDKDEKIKEFQEVRADYFHNSSGADSKVAVGGYDHLFALSFLSQTDRFTMNTDFLLANGDDQTAWGVNFTSGWWVVRDFLQLVGQYEHAGSSDDNGLRMNWGMTDALGDAIHPSVASSGTELYGNRYHSLYAGLNAYFLDQRFRLGTGVEWRQLQNPLNNSGEYESWVWHGHGIFSF